MFVRTRSADKLEGAYGLKQDSNGRSASMSMNGDGKKHQAEKDTTGDPSAATFSEFSAAQSTYKWQYERNDKRNTQLRVEAIAIIESVITKQNERKSIMTVRIKSMVDMGRARLGGSNKRGACLSMKKVLTLQSEIDRISDSVEALEKYCMGIASEAVKPEGYELKVKAFLELPAKTKTMSDTEMLQELCRLGRRLRIEETSSKKAYAPTPVVLGRLESPLFTVAKSA